MFQRCVYDEHNEHTFMCGWFIAVASSYRIQSIAAQKNPLEHVVDDINERWITPRIVDDFRLKYIRCNYGHLVNLIAEENSSHEVIR